MNKEEQKENTEETEKRVEEKEEMKLLLINRINPLQLQDLYIYMYRTCE